MKKKEITYSDTVKEAITLSLLKLITYKDFDQIRIQEIVTLAGVSRSSFYRNFKSKEQILVLYIQQQYRQYFSAELSAMQDQENIDLQQFLLKRLRFIRENKDCFTLLRENNLLEYVFENLEPELSHFLSGEIASHSPYHLAMFSGASARFIRCWIDRSFQESEEELMAMTVSNVIR